MIKMIKGAEIYYNLSNKEGVLKNCGINQAIYDMITRGNLDQTICNVTHVKITNSFPSYLMLEFIFREIVDRMKEEIQNERYDEQHTPIVIIADPLIDAWHNNHCYDMKEILMQLGFINVIMDGSLKSANNTDVMVLNNDAGEEMIDYLIAKKVVTRTNEAQPKLEP